MPREAVRYAWARVAVGPHRQTIGDLAISLGVGRHQARRLLLASPSVNVARLVTKRWRGPDGRLYVRRAWSIPGKAVAYLFMVHAESRMLRLLRPRSVAWRIKKCRLRRFVLAGDPATKKVASLPTPRVVGAAGDTAVRGSDLPRASPRTQGGRA